jgi:hypothetical protein
MTKDKDISDDAPLGNLDSTEVLVLRDALRYFSERMTPMFLKREGVRLLNYEKSIASHLVSSLDSETDLDVGGEERGVMVNALRYFTGLPTPMYAGQVAISKLRKSQEIARKLLGKL